jgi:hypothetical protein
MLWSKASVYMWDTPTFMCVCQRAERANITAGAAGLKELHQQTHGGGGRETSAQLTTDPGSTSGALDECTQITPRGEQAFMSSVRM